ncbi:hypothetical protein [Streptomyces sp. NPDC005485]|uniref:hypothetical protein n=1 Tax=Streptomyces sp. NPDC005485 TaxID=3155591 RepID=UPI0033A87FBB
MRSSVRDGVPELPRSSGIAATTLAFFHSWETTPDATGPDPRLGRVRADNVVTGLRGSGITYPPADRDLVFRHLDHCVTTGALPAPDGQRGHLPTPTK